MYHRIDALLKKAMNINFLTPEAKCLLLCLIITENTEHSIPITVVDEICKLTLADVDIAAIQLKNSLDEHTMSMFGLTSRINVSKDDNSVLLSKDWRLTDEPNSEGN